MISESKLRIYGIPKDTVSFQWPWSANWIQSISIIVPAKNGSKDSNHMTKKVGSCNPIRFLIWASNCQDFACLNWFDLIGFDISPRVQFTWCKWSRWNDPLVESLSITLQWQACGDDKFVQWGFVNGFAFETIWMIFVSPNILHYFSVRSESSRVTQHISEIVCGIFKQTHH